MRLPFGWSVVIKSAVRVNSHLFHFLFLPISSRSRSGFQLKQTDKACFSWETHHLTDFISREVCIRKQILGLCDAEGIQVDIHQTDFTEIDLRQIIRQRCNISIYVTFSSYPIAKTQKCIF